MLRSLTKFDTQSSVRLPLCHIPLRSISQEHLISFLKHPHIIIESSEHEHRQRPHTQLHVTSVSTSCVSIHGPVYIIHVGCFAALLVVWLIWKCDRLLSVFRPSLHTCSYTNQTACSASAHTLKYHIHSHACCVLMPDHNSLLPNCIAIL